MPRDVKVFAFKPDYLILIPRTHRVEREPISISCPLTSTHGLGYTYGHRCTYMYIYKSINKYNKYNKMFKVVKVCPASTHWAMVHTLHAKHLLGAGETKINIGLKKLLTSWAWWVGQTTICHRTWRKESCSVWSNGRGRDLCSSLYSAALTNQSQRHIDF